MSKPINTYKYRVTWKDNNGIGRQTDFRMLQTAQQFAETVGGKVTELKYQRPAYVS